MTDLGNGYSYRWVGWYPDRELNPQYEGIPDTDKALLILKCPHDEGAVTIEGATPSQKSGWRIVSLEPLTLDPSIENKNCGCHGYIREGKWVSV
jgi:hypothetical protein